MMYCRGLSDNLRIAAISLAEFCSKPVFTIRHAGVADLDRDVPSQSVDHIDVALNVYGCEVALDAIIVPRELVLLREYKPGNREDSSRGGSAR